MTCSSQQPRGPTTAATATPWRADAGECVQLSVPWLPADTTTATPSSACTCQWWPEVDTMFSFKVDRMLADVSPEVPAS